ncbi:S8 family peptidase [Clostridium butyricum]|uniref:S8 family peptidase n=1 Tax=Clostridium butyricum TaxID=1492 RepID=UPI000903A177|nr:S8 family peptidase [Clostridium butyricum]APF24994.1 subtilase family protein [Clostridium butyricum]
MLFRENISEKYVDASIGLLTNVPKEILDNLDFAIEENNTIELIILYRDEPENVKLMVEGLNGNFEDLGFNFGLVNIGLDKLMMLSKSRSIQYIELPKNLYESALESNIASCIPNAVSTYNVSGKGILIGFIDSGIDYMHPAFMNNEGSTRIEYIYDLSAGKKIYDKQMINEAIKAPDPYAIVNSIDSTGHGSHVVGIACGGGKINLKYKGAAPEASIAMVKSARGVRTLSSQIMRGFKFLIDKSKELNMPLVINMSLSTNNGAHNGSSLLEQYIKTIANLERITIAIAAGNEGDAGHHTGGTFKENKFKTFNIASDEKAIVINFYKSILPEISINIVNSSGQSSGLIKLNEGYFRTNIGKDRLDIYVAGPKPFELDNEIQIIISARSSYLAEGIWKMEIELNNEYDGDYSLWLPVSEGLNTNTKFLEPLTSNTLGIPATVENIIAVGSYNNITDDISSFSGRGAGNNPYTIRPDLVAPGQNISGPLPGGGYDNKTGTSMAAPQVAGICALLMEWGIIKGNDPYLFGQRLKYYLVKGAKRKRVNLNYPNNTWGYGEICAFNTFKLIEEEINSIIRMKFRDGESDNVKDISIVKKIESEDINKAIQEMDDEHYNTDFIGLIIQYAGIENLRKINDNIKYASSVALTESFAIAILPFNKISELFPYVQEIVPILIPAVYTLSTLSPIESSGAEVFKNNPHFNLSGRDVLVGMIDTGIDYLNEEFMYEDNTTRIVRIWDQTIQGDKGIYGLKFGTEYLEDEINRAIRLHLSGGDPYTIVPSKDDYGHGTMSAGLIGGRGKNPDLLGAAPACKFAVVKLKEANKVTLSYAGVPLEKKAVYESVFTMSAVRYLGELAKELNMPLVIYLPLGTNTGGHDGTNELENILEAHGKKNGVVPVVGTGNQGDTQVHTESKFEKTGEVRSIEVKVGKNQMDLNFEIFFMKPDRVSIGIISPSGEILEKVDPKQSPLKNYKFLYEGTIVNINYFIPDETTGDEIIAIRMKNVIEGNWEFRLYGDYIVDGRYWSWLPQRELLDNDTRFFNPSQYTTLSIPGTSKGVITTAYYNQDNDSTVVASGRGYTRDGRIKPDIATGAVNALIIKPGGGTDIASGSSVATSILAGCCALILQWAIVDENMPNIRTQKMISYIIRGAKMRPGDMYPNKEWGYGMLNIQSIFDSLRSMCKENIRNERIIYKPYEEVVQNTKKEEFEIGNLFFRIPKTFR